MDRRGDALERAIAHLARTPMPMIAVMGPACRTWYADQAILLELLTDLSYFGPVLVHAGRLPFDTYVVECAETLGLEHVLVGPPELEDRLCKKYQRSEALLDVDLLVAFPKEDPPRMTRWGREIRTGLRTQHGVATADPVLNRALSVPVLGIYRYFKPVFEEPWT